MPYVDFIHTKSNDIVEAYETLELRLRDILIEEITDVIDEYVNDRHIELLCDIITNKDLTAISPENY